MDDHGDTGVGEQSPHRVEHRLARVEVPDLKVHLGDLGPGCHGVGHIGRGVRLGEERQGRQNLGYSSASDKECRHRSAAMPG